MHFCQVVSPSDFVAHLRARLAFNFLKSSCFLRHGRVERYVYVPLNERRKQFTRISVWIRHAKMGGNQLTINGLTPFIFPFESHTLLAS